MPDNKPDINEMLVLILIVLVAQTVALSFILVFVAS